MTKIYLPDKVRLIMDRLHNGGYRAHIVGGCVRDSLLGKAPSDYDMTTDATPDEMLELFKDEKTLTAGIKHGTVTVVLGGECYEITTYRCDGEYTDNRHPDKVEFTRRIEKDLSRRDFTMNALAYNDIDGIVDLFCGADDIKRRVVRAVGCADTRFQEDALRIMRAMRFSAQLDFEIDAELSVAIHKNRALVANVSGERIYTELTKLLCGISPARVINEYSDVLGVACHGLYGGVRVDEKNLVALDASERLLMLYCIKHSDRAECLKHIMNDTARLHTDNAIRRLAKAVIPNIDRDLSDPVSQKRIIRDIGRSCAMSLVRMRAALFDGARGECTLMQSIIDSGECTDLGALNIDGNAVVELGGCGSEVGVILARLLDGVIRGDIVNTHTALLAECKQMIAEIRKER